MTMEELTRRDFLRLSAATVSGVLLAACQPKIVEVTKIVEKPVEKIVKETVIVAGTPKVVEKVITVAPAKKPDVTLRYMTFWPGYRVDSNLTKNHSLGSLHPFIAWAYNFIYLLDMFSSVR